MSGRVLKNIETAIRWLTVTTTVFFLIEELVRVVWYVIGEWGIFQAIIDGAVLYKMGETVILIPFFLHIHWNGVWTAERLRDFVRKTRWLIWFGGILALVASFDLFNRVDWSLWTIPLMVIALTLPPVMGFLTKRRAVWKGRILAMAIVFLVFCHYAVSFIFTGYFITPLPSSHPSPASTAQGRWQQDLEYMADNLPRLHLNAFHTVQKEQFEGEVTSLYDAIPSLDEHQIMVGFYRITAMIGDGHTAITSWSGPAAVKFPIRLYWLSDGLFVIAATEEYRNILGGKVLRLENLTVDSAFNVVSTLLPYESDGYLLHKSVRYLIDVDFLKGLGIANENGQMALVVENRDGDTIYTNLESVAQVGHQELIRLPETFPSYMSHSRGEYWSEYFDDYKTAYLKYNSFTNPVEFPKFTEEFWAMVENKSVEYVIIDFRENSGGYSSCFDSFFENILLHDNINQRGHLYHLTNRRTYSSASLYTGIIRRDTEAILAGEEMGGGLNRYGDMRTFKLPNSGVKVSYSTKYFELWPNTLPPFEMDLLLSLSSKEYFTGQDPVLDSVLQLIRLNIGID
ncbi:MAG: hypothetical protein KOO62_10140 [candidate division Zixibacteria bacterium]|nr:hypothetical protein [candidate division Zixibacteria bacterium]